MSTLAFPRHPANSLPKSRGDRQAATAARVIRWSDGLPSPKTKRPDPFDKLTAQLVMAQARAGTLNPEIVAALLLGVGLPPP